MTNPDRELLERAARAEARADAALALACAMSRRLEHVEALLARELRERDRVEGLPPICSEPQAVN